MDTNISSEQQEVPEVFLPWNKKTKIILGLVLGLIIVLGGTTIYFFVGSHESASDKAAAQNAKELSDTVAEVGKLVLLPVGETPTLATVSDPSKLKDQSFFENAVVGDKVLIYAQARKAILYSPSRHKIIEIAPINSSVATQAQSAPVIQVPSTSK